jgi:hypothetical protein
MTSTACPECGSPADLWNSTHPWKYPSRLVCSCGWQSTVPYRPFCPTHHVALTWQTGLVAPGWVCGACLESIPEEELA